MRKLPKPRSSSLSLQPCRRPVPLGLVQHHLTHHDSNPAPSTLPQRRTLAQVRPEPISELWFTSSTPFNNNPKQTTDHIPPSPRTLALGKTLRRLSPLLPNILTTPLPADLLSPTVTLHLFPSTHPHLPIVKGRTPYRAALWTAPVAWGCVPLVNNTKLTIVSEKIVRSGYQTTLLTDEETQDLGEEKLVVRWKTSPQPTSPSSPSASAPFTSSAPTPTSSPSSARQGTNSSLSTLLGGDRPLFSSTTSASGKPAKDEFTGLFIFTFTDKGLIATHTIEHADENNGFDKTSKVVTVADWLLGKAKRINGKKEEEGILVPGLAAEGLGLRGEVRARDWEGVRR
jgi:hypothetical protein